jgi:hypothetical protein
MRRILILLTPLLVGLLVAPHATAATWDSWSWTTSGTKARFEMRYGTDTHSNAVQVHRSRHSAHPHQVTVRWRTVDGALVPTSGWSQRAWKKIGRGDTVRLTAPVVTCFPTELQVQVIVRVRRAGHWTEPAAVVEHIGARISYC